MIIEISKDIPRSRVYYDQGVEILGVDILPIERCVDSIAEPIWIDLDKDKKTVSLEIFTNPEKWEISDIELPEEIENGYVIFEETDYEKLEDKIHDLSFFFKPEKKLLHIILKHVEEPRNLRIAENLIFEISKDNDLVGLWISAIELKN